MTKNSIAIHVWNKHSKLVILLVINRIKKIVEFIFKKKPQLLPYGFLANVFSKWARKLHMA